MEFCILRTYPKIIPLYTRHFNHPYGTRIYLIHLQAINGLPTLKPSRRDI